MFFMMPPVQAQDDVIPPLGARGRYTTEQLMGLALNQVPGELIETSARRDDNLYFQRYEILGRDGSVYVVEINAVTAKINKIYIESLSANPALPMAVITRENAALFAGKYIEEEKLGARKPDILSTTLGVRFQDPVYIVRVKKSGQIYAVTVDAYDGDVLSVEDGK